MHEEEEGGVGETEQQPLQQQWRWWWWQWRQQQQWQQQQQPASKAICDYFILLIQILQRGSRNKQHRLKWRTKWQKCLWTVSLSDTEEFLQRKRKICKKWPVSSAFWLNCITSEGTAVAQWLRCCATNRKVTGSIPGGVMEIFHWHNPSDRTMALASTQPLKEMSTRRISWG